MLPSASLSPPFRIFDLSFRSPYSYRAPTNNPPSSTPFRTALIPSFPREGTRPLPLRAPLILLLVLARNPNPSCVHSSFVFLPETGGLEVAQLPLSQFGKFRTRRDAFCSRPVLSCLYHPPPTFSLIRTARPSRSTPGALDSPRSPGFVPPSQRPDASSLRLPACPAVELHAGRTHRPGLHVRSFLYGRDEGELTALVRSFLLALLILKYIVFETPSPRPPPTPRAKVSLLQRRREGGLN